MKYKKNHAFTLAEVLISLTIIGVIGALVISNIKSAVFENEAVSRAKQTYAQIANAYQIYESENSCKGTDDCFSKMDTYNCDEFFTPIIEKLRIAEKVIVPIGGKKPEIRWLAPETKTIQGTRALNTLTAVSQNSVAWDKSAACYYLLENGVTVTAAGEGIWDPYNQNKRIFVSFDINGKKPPNQTGKDTFSFGIDPLGPTPEFSFNFRTSPGYAGYMCYSDIDPFWTGARKTRVSKCPGGQNIPERHPLLYVIQKSKLPDLKKIL